MYNQGDPDLDATTRPSPFVKIFTSSRWVDAVNNGVSLVLLGLLLRQPLDNAFAVALPERLLPKIKFGLTFLLLFIAAAVAFDLVKSLVLLGRQRLAKRRDQPGE